MTLGPSVAIGPLKTLVGVVTPRAKRLWAERAAIANESASRVGGLLDDELGETLDRLTNIDENQPWWRQILIEAGHLIVTPDFLAIRSVQDWLRNQEVRDNLLILARNELVSSTGGSAAVHARLADAYAEYTGEAPELAVGVVQVVVSIMLAGYLAALNQGNTGLPLAGLIQESHRSLLEAIDRREPQAANVASNQKGLIAGGPMQHGSAVDLEAQQRTLEDLDRQSRGRCVRYWMAAGVGRDEAEELAADASVGAPPVALRPTQTQPVRIILGDLGQGKSLTADRLFQVAVHRARFDVAAPIPVFFGPPWTPAQAEQILGNLQLAIETGTARLGDVARQGATIIIDGLDQAGGEWPARCLEQGYVLASVWPNTTLVTTSRPIFSLRYERDAVTLAELTDEEVLKLLDRFGTHEQAFRTILQLPPSVRHAVKRPLFAILLANYLRDEHASHDPRSAGELLVGLVEHSLGARRTTFSSAQPLLRLAAVKVIEFGGLAPMAEVGRRPALQLLLDSGLVLEHKHSQALEFSLPILAEYLAAESLAGGEPPIADLVEDAERMERWRYPFVASLAVADDATADRVLTPIAETHPAFAAGILDEAVGGHQYLAPSRPLPSIRECGHSIRQAMQAWLRGIGPELAGLIGPVDSKGVMRPLGIRRRADGELTVSWYRGTDDSIADVIELPAAVAELVPHNAQEKLLKAWSTTYHRRPGSHAAWAWRWTLDQLIAALRQRLDFREIPTKDGSSLFTEWVWERAVKITSIQSGSIPLEALLIRLVQLASSTGIPVVAFNINGVRMSRTEFDRLRNHVAELLEAGVTSLNSPYPGPDRQGSGWVWTAYSAEQLRKRTDSVFMAALDGYKQMVEAWFARHASYLQVYATLPARLTGLLEAEHPAVSANLGPNLRWFLDPQISGSPTLVAITLEPGELGDWEIRAYRQWERLSALRPAAVSWIRPMGAYEALDVFGLTPATELAYGWLGDDLYRAGWLDSHLGGPRRRW
jgi:hypothetical protein